MDRTGFSGFVITKLQQPVTNFEVGPRLSDRRYTGNGTRCFVSKNITRCQNNLREAVLSLKPMQPGRKNNVGRFPS